MSLQGQLLTLHRVNTQVTGLRQRLDSAKRFLAAQTRIQEQVKQQESANSFAGGPLLFMNAAIKG